MRLTDLEVQTQMQKFDNLLLQDLSKEAAELKEMLFNDTPNFGHKKYEYVGTLLLESGISQACYHPIHLKFYGDLLWEHLIKIIFPRNVLDDLINSIS